MCHILVSRGRCRASARHSRGRGFSCWFGVIYLSLSWHGCRWCTRDPVVLIIQGVSPVPWWVDSCLSLWTTGCTPALPRVLQRSSLPSSEQQSHPLQWYQNLNLGGGGCLFHVCSFLGLSPLVLEGVAVTYIYYSYILRVLFYPSSNYLLLVNHLY